MKKFFYFAAALVATVACTKTTVDELPDQVIGFAVANYSTQTKAEIDGKNTSAFPYDAFGVYAWYDADNTTAADAGTLLHQIFMDNEIVSKKTGETDWKVQSKTYYWPKTGNVDFIAYYPQSATPWITINDDATQLDGSFTSNDGSEDYMYADKASNYTANTNPAKYNAVSGVAAGVPTLFHHALAKVSVNLKKADNSETSTNKWDVTVTSAYFDQIVADGTCTLVLAAAETAGQNAWKLKDNTNSIWEAGSTEKNIAVSCGNGINLTTSFPATPYLNGYTVLPQKVSGKKFHIEYTVVSYYKDGTSWKSYATEKVVKNIDLFNASATVKFTEALQYWQMNKSITYNITINPIGTEIIFDPAVVEWETPEKNPEVSL